MTKFALLLCFSLLLTFGCSTVRSLSTDPLDPVTPDGQASATTETPAPDDSTAVTHLKLATKMAQDTGDKVGERCWMTSLVFLDRLRPALAHVDGLSPTIQAGRNLKRAAPGDAKEEFLVACSPVWVEARLDPKVFLIQILGSRFARLFD